jgi:hypothetical protein
LPFDMHVDGAFKKVRLMSGDIGFPGSF